MQCLFFSSNPLFSPQVSYDKVSLVFVKDGVATKTVTGNAAADLFVQAVKDWGYQYAPDGMLPFLDQNLLLIPPSEHF